MVIPRGRGREEKAVGVGEAVGAVEAAVAMAGELMPGRMAMGSVTRVTSNASNAMPMGITPIDARVRRRRRKLTLSRWRGSLQFCWQKLYCRISYSVLQRTGFRNYF